VYVCACQREKKKERDTERTVNRQRERETKQREFERDIERETYREIKTGREIRERETDRKREKGRKREGKIEREGKTKREKERERERERERKKEQERERKKKKKRKRERVSLSFTRTHTHTRTNKDILQNTTSFKPRKLSEDGGEEEKQAGAEASEGRTFLPSKRARGDRRKPAYVLVCERAIRGCQRLPLSSLYILCCNCVALLLLRVGKRTAPPPKPKASEALEKLLSPSNIGEGAANFQRCPAPEQGLLLVQWHMIMRTQMAKEHSLAFLCIPL